MKLQVAIIALALNSVFFFRGCDKDHTLHVSLGIALPAATFEVDRELGAGALPSRLVEVSPLLLAVNAGLGALLGIVLLRRCERRRLWISLGLASSTLNSFTVWAAAWVNVVLWPSAWLGSLLRGLLYLGEPDPTYGEIDPRGSASIASRIWFAAIFALTYGLLAAVSRLRARAASRRRPPAGASEIEDAGGA